MRKANKPDIHNEQTAKEKIQSVMAMTPEIVEKIKWHKSVLNDLASAFGDLSIVTPDVVGMAIAGQVHLRGLQLKPEMISDIVDQICESSKNKKIDPEEVRKMLFKGMREEAKRWPADASEAWTQISLHE